MGGCTSKTDNVTEGCVEHLFFIKKSIFSHSQIMEIQKDEKDFPPWLFFLRGEN